MTPINRDSNLFCIMVEDPPAITAKIKGLMAENESLRARIIELESANALEGGSLARALLNARLNKRSG